MFASSKYANCCHILPQGKSSNLPFLSFVCLVFDRDGIHLSSEGNKIVAKEILKVLREAEWEPSLHWKSMPSEFSEDSPYDPIGADAKTPINVSNWNFQGSSQWD